MQCANMNNKFSNNFNSNEIIVEYSHPSYYYSKDVYGHRLEQFLISNMSNYLYLCQCVCRWKAPLWHLMLGMWTTWWHCFIESTDFWICRTDNWRVGHGVQHQRLDSVVHVVTLDMSQRKEAEILWRASGDDMYYHPEPPNHSSQIPYL